MTSVNGFLFKSCILLGDLRLFQVPKKERKETLLGPPVERLEEGFPFVCNPPNQTRAEKGHAGDAGDAGGPSLGELFPPNFRSSRPPAPQWRRFPPGPPPEWPSAAEGSTWRSFLPTREFQASDPAVKHLHSWYGLAKNGLIFADPQ